MAKKIDTSMIEQIGNAAAHRKNESQKLINKTKVKTKTITYPEFWECELFDKKVKNRTFSGTWQGFIRDAIREKLISLNVDIDEL